MTIVSILQKILAEAGDVGDKEYLSKKQFDGKLFKEISAEFVANAVQITHIVPAGKTFYLVSAKLYPVTNVVTATGALADVDRSVDVELKFDGILVDVLTYTWHFEGDGGNRAAAGNAGQFDSGIIDSFDGDGVKVIELTSTSTSGTYRVSLMGFEEDTGTDPTLLAQSITVDANITGEATDIGFIQDRVLTGNYFHVITDISVPANKATFTVPDGKTAFLLEAKITMITNPGPGATQNDSIVATLQKNINTTITEFSKAKIGLASNTFTGVREIGGAGFGAGGYCPFNVKGFSLVGSGVLNKIEIENTLDSGSAMAEFSGYLV